MEKVERFERIERVERALRDREARIMRELGLQSPNV